MRKNNFIIISVFSLVFALFLLLLSSTINITGDEVLHIPVGYSQITTGKFGINPFLPHFVSQLSATPLILLGLEFPYSEISYVEYGNLEQFSIDFLYNYNYEQINNIVFFSRIPIIIISIILGIFVFIWSRSLFGINGAIISLILYSTSTVIIGNSILVITDFVSAAFVFISSYFIYRYIKSDNKYDLVSSFIIAGLAVSSKTTGLFLIPIFFIFFIIFNKKKITSFKLIIILSLFIFTILFSSYHFELRSINSVIFNDMKTPSFISKEILDFPIPLTWFLKGLYMESIPDVIGGRASMNSLYPLYFINGFLSVNTIPFLILFLTSIIIIKFTGVIKEEIIIILPIIFFIIFFSFSSLDFGLRYIIVIFPFLFVLMGRLSIMFKHRLSATFIILLLASCIINTILIYPNYLSYNNGLVDFYTPEYRGSSINQLKNYMEYEGYENVSYAVSGFWIDEELERLDIKYIDFCGEVSGLVMIEHYIFIGLRGDNECYSWIRSFEPKTYIGGVLVYDL